MNWKLILILFYVSFSQKTFPTISQDFSAIIEKTSALSNSTQTLIETWDVTHNRGKVEYHRHGEVQSVIIFANQQKEYFIDYLTHSCSLFNPSNSSRIDENGNLKNSRDIFFSTNWTYTYVGNDQVRGIQADLFTTNHTETFSRGTMAVTVDFWFAVPEWNIRGYNIHSIPLRVHIYGTFTDLSQNIRPIDNSMDYIGFIVGESENFVRDRTFSIPHYCPNTFEVRPLPTLPDSYRTVVTVTNVRDRSTYSFIEHLHYTKQSRVDFSFNTSRFSYIHDGQKNLSYFVDKSNNNFCNSIPWGQRNRVDRRTLSPSQIYDFSQNFTFQYMGQEFIDDVRCDVWSTQYTEEVTMRFTINWYFSADSWNIYGNGKVPIRTLFTGAVSNTLTHINNFEIMYDYSEFLSGESFVPLSMFQIPKGCLVELTPIPQPTLPDSFYSLAQISYPLTRTTFTVQEWYDYNLDALKIEFHTNGHRNVTLLLADKGKVYQQYSSFDESITPQCVVSPLVNTTNMIFQNGHLRTFQQLLHFGQRSKYTGRDWVRGISCDHWFSNFTASLYGFTNQFWTHEVFFSTEGWSHSGSGDNRFPVRVITTGYPIGPFGRPSHVPNFEVTIDFLGYVAGSPPAYEFNPPIGCADHVVRKMNEEFGLKAEQASGVYIGLGVSFSLIGIISGLIGGVLFAFFASRAERMASPTSKGFGKIDTY